MNRSDSNLIANSANPAEPLAPLAELASATTPPSTSFRDSQGRFLTGNSGGGRRLGSRNKLTETVLSTLAIDFTAHGAAALAQLRTSDPEAYLRLVVALLPRELVLQREQQPEIDYAELSYEEIGKLADDERKRRMVTRVIEES